GGGGSRTTVLVDGVPLNDPFGGWVYWSRVPEASIERVETARGGSSSLYGTDALGGVVQIITDSGRRGSWLSVEASAGSQTTSEASFAAGARGGPWRGPPQGRGGGPAGEVLARGDQGGAASTAAAPPHP